jgi:hypothetical protein
MLSEFRPGASLYGEKSKELTSEIRMKSQGNRQGLA